MKKFLIPLLLLCTQAHAYQDVDANGVIQSAGQTYGAAILNVGLAIGSSDLVTIGTSNSRVVRIKNIAVSGILTTGTSVFDMVILKRSNLDSGGTSVVATNIPFDSNYPSASAIITTYSNSGPTTGGSIIGKIKARKVLLGTSTGSALVPFLIDFSLRGEQALVLRGTEQAALSLNGQTVGGSMNVDVTWTEE